MVYLFSSFVFSGVDDMILTYYNILFVLSIIFMMLMALRWQVRIDVDFAIFFLLVPIDILGYIKLATAQGLEAAILANQLIYLGGCFLQLFALLVVCNICHIRLSTAVRGLLFGISISIYLCVLTIGKNNLFYSDVSLVRENGVSILVKEYGPAHKFFYIMIVLYMVFTIATLIYAYIKKPDVSLRNLYILAFVMGVTVIAFFGGRAFTRDVELAPAGYLLAEALFLFIAHRVRLYNITGDIAVNVLEEGADGLICFDLEKKLLISNKTAQDMIPALKKAHADHMLNETVLEFRQIGERITQFETGDVTSARTIDIGKRSFQTRVEYIKDGKKNVGYYIVLRDVTAERKYLDSINKYNEQMREATDAAIAADNAKSKFLAQMSHEIRTPINAILGMNEMIMQECQDDSILDYAGSIETSGHTLLYLINSILDFSKIEDGRMEIIPAEYDTVSFIEKAVTSTKTRAADKGLKFEILIDDTLPSKMKGDDMRLTQVITNLLSNAVKYTDKGQITLSVKRNRGMGKEVDDNTNIWLHVEVSDTGIGIRKEDLNRLFYSFERLDESRNRNIEGTGLGMAIVYRMLDLMGSHIYVKSEYGKGSTFWFDIRQDIIDPKPIGNYKERAAIDDMRSKKNITFYAPDARVLVVDDNALNQKVTRNYLKLCGIVPDEAMSGLAAIELMKQNTYDVVFLDHMMPELDGIETLKIIRRDNLAPENTIMVVLTANAIEGSREMYIREGFDDYISKPVELTAMVAKLEGYLTHGRRSLA